SLNKVDLIDAGESDFYSEDIENFLNNESIPIGVENYVFDPEGDILFLERLLSEEPHQLLPMNLNQAKSSIEEPEYSFSMGDDFTSNDEDVPIEESKFHSNLLFDNDEINSDELESPVEYNLVESLSNHDTLKRDHTEYISRMEMLFIINLRFENDDSEGEIDVVEELHVDNSISNSENELSDNEESDFDNPSFLRLPPELPDDEFDFELNSGENISVVMNDNDELECLDPRDEIDDDYFPFMFVIRFFPLDLIYSKVFLFLLSTKSEDTILTLDLPLID
nr:hypothetical protein [Tanacetum cinerariifolium]